MAAKGPEMTYTEYEESQDHHRDHLGTLDDDVCWVVHVFNLRSAFHWLTSGQNVKELR